jgi:hypothetical protein
MCIFKKNEIQAPDQVRGGMTDENERNLKVATTGKNVIRLLRVSRLPKNLSGERDGGQGMKSC